jgi:hypothetical protein
MRKRRAKHRVSRDSREAKQWQYVDKGGRSAVERESVSCERNDIGWVGEEEGERLRDLKR